MEDTLHGYSRLIPAANDWLSGGQRLGLGFEVPGLNLSRDEPCSEAIAHLHGHSKVLTFVSGTGNMLRFPLGAESQWSGVHISVAVCSAVLL